ncbi:MAG TPA: hypothetical protein P5572_07170 [Phycisphaerae bacterium]|nr:hypothetical protein [Phycisphaerae bacterium]
MAITQEQTKQVEEFRAWVEQQLDGDDRFGTSDTFDREDGSTLTTRWTLSDDLMLEVTVRPLIPQVRVGVVTEDRWKSEEIEQAIEDSGDNMSEYLEVALAEVELDWVDPPVEHYRDQGRWYSFVTPIDLTRLAELSDAAVQKKVLQLIDGYVNSYGSL